MSLERASLVVLADKALQVFCRELARLEGGDESGFEVVDGGFDSWLRSVYDSDSTALSQPNAALAFVMSPRILELADIESTIEQLLSRLDALAPRRTVFMSNFVADPRQAAPLLSHVGAARVVMRLTDRLLTFASERTWFHVVDHLGIVARHGLERVCDARFENAAQMCFSPGGQKLLAGEWHRAIRASRTVPAKVLVTDLDNTLWGGILGEDGFDGLQMSPAPDGWPYRRLQQAMLQLSSRGVLLAVASKNNPDDAIRALNEHPDCLLRADHFAALEIGWESKSEGLKRISKKLSLGLDSFVFLDDSSFEREEIRQTLPQVRVLEFPADRTDLGTLLFRETAFDTLRLTAEDQQRSASYRAESQRQELQRRAPTPEEFFRSLDIRVIVQDVGPSQLSRVHQLVNKTNQFNLATERLTESEIGRRIDAPEWWCLTFRVVDKFGDSGLTGVAFIDRSRPDDWRVANFLLSCRVIGRTVENAFVSWLAGEALVAGVNRLSFAFRRNEKNIVAQEFVEKCRFQRVGNTDAWEVVLTDEVVANLPKNYVALSFSNGVK